MASDEIEKKIDVRLQSHISTGARRTEDFVGLRLVLLAVVVGVWWSWRPPANSEEAQGSSGGLKSFTELPNS